jgi:cytidylate kinase
VRAERRYRELIEKGMAAEFNDVLKNLEKRDHIDSNRDDSPLRKADDAILLDNSDLTLEQQMTWFRILYQNVISEINDKN